jgi:hypothetical protein
MILSPMVIVPGYAESTQNILSHVVVCGIRQVPFTPVLQKPEGFRVKASEGEVVVFYFEPSATQDLKFSGFPAG